MPTIFLSKIHIVSQHVCLQADQLVTRLQLELIQVPPEFAKVATNKYIPKRFFNDLELKIQSQITKIFYHPCTDQLNIKKNKICVRACIKTVTIMQASNK
jgi:hypothetical protein